MTTAEKAKLATLIKAERYADRVMMNGTVEDCRTVYGEEGKNYIAWCAAADALRTFRQELAA